MTSNAFRVYSSTKLLQF